MSFNIFYSFTERLQRKEREEPKYTNFYCNVLFHLAYLCVFLHCCMSYLGKTGTEQKNAFYCFTKPHYQFPSVASHLELNQWKYLRYVLVEHSRFCHRDWEKKFTSEVTVLGTVSLKLIVIIYHQRVDCTDKTN